MVNEKLQKELVEKAQEAAGKAYAPYSEFRVGAALLPAGGRRRIVTGCNVENASYGLTVCAERSALAAAVAAGYRKFQALAVVVSGKKRKMPPCGACLQVLAEFCGPDFQIFTAASGRPDKINVYRLRDLLPHVFRLNH